MVTYIAVGIMVLMAVIEVIFMNGIFTCISIAALSVALLSVFNVPYVITAIVAAIVLVISFVFLRPVIINYIRRKHEEINNKYKEVIEDNKSDEDVESIIESSKDVL